MRRTKMYLFLASLVAVIVLVIAGYSVYVMYNTYMYPAGTAKDILTRSELGQIGDYFGGILNPILGFLTVSLLVGSALLSRRQVIDTRAQLQLSKDEYNRKQLEDILVKLFAESEVLVRGQLTNGLLFHAPSQKLCARWIDVIDNDKAFNTTYSQELVKFWKETKEAGTYGELFSAMEFNMNRIFTLGCDILKVTHLNSLKDYWYLQAYDQLELYERIGFLSETERAVRAATLLDSYNPN